LAPFQGAQQSRALWTRIFTIQLFLDDYQKINTVGCPVDCFARLMWIDAQLSMPVLPKFTVHIPLKALKN
jgi:hypothetical protein